MCTPCKSANKIKYINPIDLGAGTGAWFTQLNMQYKNDNVRLCEDTEGAIHSTKIPTGPTGKRGPPQKVDPFFRNFSSWTEPIH